MVMRWLDFIFLLLLLLLLLPLLFKCLAARGKNVKVGTFETMDDLAWKAGQEDK